MNKKIITCLTLSMFLLFASSLIAQTSDTIVRKEKRIVIIQHTPDSTKEIADSIQIKEIENIEIDTIVRRPYRVKKIVSEGELALGFANIIPASGSAVNSNLQGLPELNNGKSIHFGLGQNWGFNLSRGKWRIWTGIRYDVQNYRFADNKTRLAAGKSTFTTTLDTNDVASKSKVAINYIGIPVAIGYHSRVNEDDKGFYVHLGIAGGYRIRSLTKVKLEENSKKVKEFDDFNFNDVAVTPFVYIGYNSFGFYARYTVTSLFKSGQGAEANAIQFGIVLM